MIWGSRNKQDMTKFHLLRVKADACPKLAFPLSSARGFVTGQASCLFAKPCWPGVHDNTGKKALGTIWGQAQGFQTPGEQTQWRTPSVQSQQDQEFRANLGCITRPCLTSLTPPPN